MNFSIIKYFCGIVLRFEAGFMALSLVVSFIYGEYDVALIFIGTIAVMLGISFLLAFRKPADTSFYAKEGVVTVSVSWILLSLFGAMPFFLSGAIPSFIDSLFESVSGFTTTGASVLIDVEIVEKSLLFWRSFTHWIGGMGVLMFIMAILPMSKADPLHLMRAESPGPTTEKLVPKASETAKILYSIYIGLSLLEVILLLAGGMPLYDSVVHMFGTAGTGGFSMKNASIGAYDSVYLEVVVTVFMILFGVNFSAYFLLLARKFKRFLTFEELRVYLAIIIIAMAVIAFNITGTVYQSLGESLRHSSFQVASVMTTTGFSTDDFNQWPTFSRFLLLLLMFIGASAGSTGGGIKVSRFMIMAKALKREAMHILHPKAVQKIKLDKMPVSEDVIRGTAIFMVVFLGITAVSIVLVSLNGFDMDTSVSAVVACINNIGPGLGVVSPVGNYSGFSVFSKIVLSLNMLIGRLEIYPMLLLISPAVWHRKA
ncbi:TrkH family potassium uptake protein [Candidatus Nomurabacteria bacterium]|nr:TrkH family potassium uptake protein [Candidatus Nomurabacteria bacterium]